MITIDGTSGAGKSTLSCLLADALGYHLLNSGLLYRALAYLLLQDNAIDRLDNIHLQKLAEQLDVHFRRTTTAGCYQVEVNGIDVTDKLYDPACSTLASQIAVKPNVRAVLLDKQRMFRQFPGLVAEGRDMGSIVFQDANKKFFLTALIEERAKRRSIQLQETMFHANVHNIERQLAMRDQRDQQRAVAPLKPTEDMVIIDTTYLSRKDVLDNMLKKVLETKE